MRKLLLFVCLLCSSTLFAQMKEQRVFLWDVTGSLLTPKATTTKMGTEIPGYPKGNGLFDLVQWSVWQGICDAEIDPLNTIAVVPFQENPLDVWIEPATSEGKERLKQKIANFKYKGHSTTSVVSAIHKFHALKRHDHINYMFLYTDGGDKSRNELVKTIKNWDAACYGFYVIVHPMADIRRDVGQEPENFWFVNDAKVQIKVCSLPNKIVYNLKDDKSKKIAITGHHKKVDSSVSVKLKLETNPFYDIKLLTDKVQSGNIDVCVTAKDGVVPPQTFDLTAEIECDGDKYTFITPKTITINCINKPVRTLNIRIKE